MLTVLFTVAYLHVIRYIYLFVMLVALYYSS